MNKITQNKKAQVWTIDFVIGLLIFLVLLFTAIALIRDYVNEKDTYSDVKKEAQHVSSILVSEGLPSDWTNDTVTLPGITNNNRVNLTKLTEYDNLSYAHSKILLQTKGEFIFYFYNGSSIINQTKCFRGYNLTSGCIFSAPANAKNLATMERFVILNSKIVKLVVVSWD
jgi:hypothetical protein